MSKSNRLFPDSNYTLLLQHINQKKNEWSSKSKHMANTYSQMYVQIVFAVKFRECLINSNWEEELYRYISGIVTNKGQKLLAINGMPDHIHILIGIKPTCNPSDLVREIKKASTEFIKSKKFVTSNFQWQEGFGIFTYNHSDLDRIINYILYQKEHHRKQSFREEYTEQLLSNNVEHKPEYLFEWIE